jgi:hypothetical protein
MEAVAWPHMQPAQQKSSHRHRLWPHPTEAALAGILIALGLGIEEVSAMGCCPEPCRLWQNSFPRTKKCSSWPTRRRFSPTRERSVWRDAIAAEVLSAADRVLTMRKGRWSRRPRTKEGDMGAVTKHPRTSPNKLVNHESKVFARR